MCQWSAMTSSINDNNALILITMSMQICYGVTCDANTSIAVKHKKMRNIKIKVK